MEPKPHTGDSNGSADGPIQKPLDKAPGSYTSNETVPQDDFHEEPAHVDGIENEGDLSTRFM